MASVPRFQFSFGDFSEEEHTNYLDLDSSCVEFPLSWCSDGDGCKGSVVGVSAKVNPFKPCSNGPTVKDLNHNHVPNHEPCPDVKPPTTTIESKNASPVDTTTVPSHEINGMVAETDAEPNVALDSEQEKEEVQVDEPITQPQTEPVGGLVNGHVPDFDEYPPVLDNLSLNGKSEVNQKLLENDAELMQKDNAADPSSKLSSSSSSPPPSKEKTWASLFSGSQQVQKQTKPVLSTVAQKPTQQTQTAPKDTSYQKKKQSASQNGLPNASKLPLRTEVVEVENDPFSKQIAEQISKNEIVYRTPGLMPRGFINSSNWCYVNATLQALLTSSPFCHLMRSLPSRQACNDTNVLSTSTPVLDSFIRLVKELKPLPKKAFQRNGKELCHGTPYEPDYIYKMLATIESKFSERGRQEDAEEFLSCVLNGLHEEMLKLTDFYFGKNSSPSNHEDPAVKNTQAELGYEVPVHDDEPAEDSNEEEDQWEEVTATRKNRSSVMRRADITKTPVSDVFRGELRSDLFQEGQRCTPTLEPFFTLPLDIKDHQKKWSVAEALEHLTRMESVQDFTNSKTKAKVEATRRLTLQTLPPVLILHLKRFIYDKEGGSLKIDKEVQYHTDLLIGKELLSKSGKKISPDKRTYKLFAVVYHHGKAATGGHYTTDVYHDGLNCWLRIDDQHIKNTNVHEVVRHNPERTAYLLYYKRTDLMAV